MMKAKECNDFYAKTGRMICGKCESENVMERKGILNNYAGYVCLNCGHILTSVKVCELNPTPMRKKEVG